MPPKLEFLHGRFTNFWGVREYTQCTILCDQGVFQALVTRHHRDPPNRKIARYQAMAKAMATLPRAQRLEIAAAWNQRNVPKVAHLGASSAAPGSELCPSTISTPTPAIEIEAHS